MTLGTLPLQRRDSQADGALLRCGRTAGIDAARSGASVAA